VITHESIIGKFLVFLIFLIPFDMIKVFGYSYIYFTGTLFIILFMSLNLRLYIDKKIIYILILYSLLNMVSLIYTDYFKVSLIHNIKLLFFMLFMVFVTSYLKKYRNDGSQLLKSFVYGVFIAVIFAFIEQFISGTGRLYGPLKMDPNAFGLMCLFAIHFVYKLQLKNKYFLIGIFILAILFTLSRTALGFLVLYLLYKNIISNKKLNFKKLLFVSLGLPILIVTVISFASKRNINTDSSSFISELTSGRSIFILMGLQMTYNNPILGNGSGVFIEESKRLRNKFTEGTSWGDHGIAGAAHNTYIEILVGVGIVGLFVYLIFLKMLYKRIANKEDKVLFLFLLLMLFTLSEEFNRIFWLIVPVLIYSYKGDEKSVHIKNN